MEQNKNHSTDAPEDRPKAVVSEHKTGLLAKLTSNKKVMWVVIGVVVLALLGLIYLLTNKDHPKNTGSNKLQNSTANQDSQQPATQSNDAFLGQYGQGCEDRDVKFTSPPMKLNELGYIRPLGAVADGHVTPTDHVYVGGTNPNAAANSYAVLMPADGTVTTVAAMPGEYIGDRANQKTASEDHRLVISHSCRYFSILIHINKLGDKLKAEVGTLQPNESKQTSVALKAGEVIGYIGSSTFDWTPVDTQTTLKGFITPSLYEGESWKIHTISPFDLYEGDLKTQLEAKSLRTVAPLGGKIDYDQPGKLIGNWFREGTGGYTGPQGNNGGRYWDGHLSIAPDYVDPSSTIVSIGNWTGDASQMVVSGSVDPSKITDKDGIVKYELRRLNYQNANGLSAGNKPTKGLKPSQTEPVQGTIIFQVMSGEKLKIEKFPGKTPAQVSGFTSAAQIYER